MASCLVGHTGFVGGNLATQREWDVRINSTNCSSFQGHYELVVYCAAPGSKWVANKNPQADLWQIRWQAERLQYVTADRFILISTADVFGQPVNADERDTPYPDTAYGRNRLFLEHMVRRLFPYRFTIVRLPGVYGPGLKKNALHDLQYEKRLDELNPKSVYQWRDVTTLWNDIKDRHEPVIHLCAPQQSLEETVERDYPHLKGKLTGTGTPAQYNLRSVYEKHS